MGDDKLAVSGVYETKEEDVRMENGAVKNGEEGEVSEVAVVANQAEEELEKNTSPPPTPSEEKQDSKDDDTEGVSSPGDKQKADKKKLKKKKTGAGGGEENEKTAPTPSRRFYLVRVPKPFANAELAKEVAQLDARCEAMRQHVKMTNEALRFKKMKKQNARGETEEARGSLKEITVEVKEKLDEIKPMKDVLKKQKDESASLRNMGKEFGSNVRSEAELDAAIEAMESTIAHESMSLGEEKNLIRKIKELKAKRPEVREFEAKIAKRNETSSQTKTDSAEIEKALQMTRGEIDVLKMQQQVQYEVFKTHMEFEKGLDEEIKVLSEERERLKADLDVAWQLLRKRRNEIRKNENEWYAHRKDVARLREMVATGDFDAASDFASQQQDKMHTKLSNDKEYRSEYFSLLIERNPKKYWTDADLEKPLPNIDGTADKNAKSAEKKPASAKKPAPAPASAATTTSSSKSPSMKKATPTPSKPAPSSSSTSSSRSAPAKEVAPAPATANGHASSNEGGKPSVQSPPTSRPKSRLSKPTKLAVDAPEILEFEADSVTVPMTPRTAKRAEDMKEEARQKSIIGLEEKRRAVERKKARQANKAMRIKEKETTQVIKEKEEEAFRNAAELARAAQESAVKAQRAADAAAKSAAASVASLKQANGVQSASKLKRRMIKGKLVIDDGKKEIRGSAITGIPVIDAILGGARQKDSTVMLVMACILSVVALMYVVGRGGGSTASTA